ncbi:MULTISPECIES: hypothetical protein [unclassified Microbacterium]|uniref:hypothetical protein n=1 Tax=unclassified Microbacterium TaxID=2609290 RepID=UPI003440F52A
MDNPLVIGAVIVIIIVVAMLAPRWIRRSSGSRGRRAGRRFEEDRVLEILEDLGATVVLHATPDSARSIVDDVVRRDPRRFTVLDDGSYGIRFLEPDDAVARLVGTPDGMRLQVERFGEHLGRPNTSAFWNVLRAAVLREATARGIGTTVPDAPQLFDRVAGDSPIWVLVDPSS